MQVQCPICGKDGSLQQRYNSVRVGHYKGWKGKTRIIEWHPTTVQNVLMVNKTQIYRDEHGKLALFTKPLEEGMENQHCLPKRQTHNLENKMGQTPMVQKSRARIPPPAPFYQLELDSKLLRIKKSNLTLSMSSQSAHATMKNSLIRRERIQCRSRAHLM